MFLGSYKSYFNGKNRLVLPRKIRKELEDSGQFYIIMGEDGEIWGFDLKNWEELTRQVLNQSLSSFEGRHQRRKFFSLADECVLDRQGRFILPNEFVDRSGIGEEVVIVGAGDHFEIWDPKRWSQIESNLSRRT